MCEILTPEGAISFTWRSLMVEVTGPTGGRPDVRSVVVAGYSGGPAFPAVGSRRSVRQQSSRPPIWDMTRAFALRWLPVVASGKVVY